MIKESQSAVEVLNSIAAKIFLEAIIYFLELDLPPCLLAGR
jgi:hypothetical protein